MNLETIYFEIKDGRALTSDEQMRLKAIVFARSAEPYELSQAVLGLCLVSPPDPELADSVVDLALEYVLSEDEWQIVCAEWMVLSLSTEWHFPEKLEALCREVAARWAYSRFETLFRQCAIVIGEIAAKRHDRELFEFLRQIGIDALEADNSAIAEKAAVGCKVALEGAVADSLRVPNNIADYLHRVRFAPLQ